MSFADYESDDCGSGEEYEHQQLLQEIKALDSPNKFSKICEVKKHADLTDLVASIKSTRNVNELKKKLHIEPEKSSRNARKFKKRNKVLEPPLHSRAKIKIESEAAYQRSKNELHQWNNTVNSLRTADQIVFPLESEETIKIETADQRICSSRPKTTLEKKMAEVLHGSKYNLTNDDEICEAEKEILKSMDAEEATMKLNEMRYMRTLTSYKGAKLKREARIKSKKYHKVRKREKRRELQKQFEEMIVTCPEKATEKLNELEKDRVFERATLKHRGISKWSREMKQFSSRNPELKKLLEEQIKLGKELKGRPRMDFDIDDTDSEDNSLGKEKTLKLAVDEASREEPALKPFVIENIDDNPFLRTALENIKSERKRALRATASGIKNDEAGNGKSDILQLSPEGFIKFDNITDRSQDPHRDLLAKAYEDDECLEDFLMDKDLVEDGRKQQHKDEGMAGWGQWTGPGMREPPKVSNRRPNTEPRKKESKKQRVIIRQQISPMLVDLQPRDIPFPFTSIKDYEAFIQQPLGLDWSTPMAHSSLIQPSIITKAGKIIHPLNKAKKLMSEDHIRK